jgi:hypothetical protein
MDNPFGGGQAPKHNKFKILNNNEQIEEEIS